MGRGRKPKLSEAELVEAIESLTSPAWPVVDKDEIHEELDDPPTKKTVLNTLQRCADPDRSPESRIRGRTPGNQKGWVWWTIPRDESDT